MHSIGVCPVIVVLSADAGDLKIISGAYSYSFSHAIMSCSLNAFDVIYSGKRVGDSANSTFSNGNSPADTLDLALGTHTFRYTINDDQGYSLWIYVSNFGAV